jgi:HEAT repeat protein
LDDPDASVREQALASLPKLGVASSPELIRTLEHLLKDPSVKVAARAAVVLMHLGKSDQAVPALSAWMKDGDQNHRSAVLIGYLAIAFEAKEAIPFDRDLILVALNDPVPAVRRQAVRVASYFMDDEMIEIVARGLSDEDVVVRKTVSGSLKQAWPRSRSVLLHALSESDEVVVSSALDAIPAGDVDILHPLKAYIQREVAVIHYWRSLIDVLPPSGRMVKLLVDILKYRVSSSEERLVKAVGLFGNPRAMDLVSKGLKAGDASSRAAALEALETLGDKRIANDVLPILDRGGLLTTDADEKMRLVDAVKTLLEHEEQRLRILAMYVVAELGIRELFPALRKAATDHDQLIKESARDALSRLGGAIIMKTSRNLKTLKTLSLMDRLILLREVPMFAGLSPEDLERVANIAEEQLYLDQSLLCREGEFGDTLFIITSGKVEVIKTVGNTEKVLASRGVGEFVGEMAILESAPRSATLRANGSVRVLVINGDAFTAILFDRPEVAVSALRHMSKRVRQLNEQVGAVS